jgi:predicted  nucleic acid-binding Zn-ribbon protein
MKSVQLCTMATCLLVIGWFSTAPALGWVFETRNPGPWSGPWFSPEVWSITGVEDAFTEVPTIPGPGDDVIVNHAIMVEGDPIYVQSLTVGEGGVISGTGSDLEIWTTGDMKIGEGGYIVCNSDPNTQAGGNLTLVSGNWITIQTSGEIPAVHADYNITLETHEGISFLESTGICVSSDNGSIIMQVPSEEMVWLEEGIQLTDIVQPEPTIDYVLVIDDFEDYPSNYESEYANWIWLTWLDGYYDPNNGSTVGNEGDLAELEIVYNGRQSMPFYYNNTEGVTESVAYRIWDMPQDWSHYDVLSLWIYGDPNNIITETNRFYCRIEDTSDHTATIIHYDPNILIYDSWQQWVIPVSDFTQYDVDLSSVKSLKIGLDNGGNQQAGSWGQCYFDDIFMSKSIYHLDFWDKLPQPELISLDTVAVIGESIDIEVRHLYGFAPGIIYWNDSFTTEINTEGVYSHTYDNPGEYNITLRSFAGVTVLPVPAVVRPHPLPISVDLNLVGTDIDGTLIEGRLAQIEHNTTNPPTLNLAVTAQDLTVLIGTFVIETPTTVQYTPFEIVFDSNEQTIQTEIETLSLTDIFSDYGFYKLSAEIQIDGENNEQLAPLPVTAQVFQFVTEDYCKDIKRQYDDLKAQREAIINDCNAIEKKITELQEQKADEEKQKDELNNKKANHQNELADKQTEFKDLFDDINYFLKSELELIQYHDSNDIPQDCYHFGAKLKSATSGLAILFSSVEVYNDKFDLYEKVYGHTLGSDIGKLRKLISEMDGLTKKIGDDDKAINSVTNQINDTQNDINSQQAKLNQCKQECDQLQQQIEALVEAEKKCLQQIHEQAKAEDAIRSARNRGNTVQKQANNVKNNADKADETIDNRAGKPEEVQEDKDKVNQGRQHQEAAQDLIDQGNRKLEDANGALSNGDTETAKELSSEADDLFKQAKHELQEAREPISEGKASALSRPKRECQDGECKKTGETITFIKWTELMDFSLSQSENTKPEKWATTLENCRNAVEGLKSFVKLVESLEKYSPIDTTFTLDADELIGAIFNGYVELLYRHYTFYVWVKLKGHTAWRRVDQECKDGLWKDLVFEGEDDNECFKEMSIGPIFPGDRAYRDSQLDNLLKRNIPRTDCGPCQK